MTVAVRSYIVRQPGNPHLIAQIFSSVGGFLPCISAMDQEQCSELAQASNAEVEPPFQVLIEGDKELYPMSTHIALAWA